MAVFRRLLALAAAVFLADCGPSPVDPDRDWLEVKEQTSCEVLVPAYCVGTYGFTIRNDGSFLVGPAPGGATVGGTLTASERTKIAAHVAAVDANLPGIEECDAPRLPPGVSDRVELLSTRSGRVTVFLVNSRMTCYVGGRDPVNRMHDDLQQLMLKYYPRPFPG